MGNVTYIFNIFVKFGKILYQVPIICELYNFKHLCFLEQRLSWNILSADVTHSPRPWGTSTLITSTRYPTAPPSCTRNFSQVLDTGQPSTALWLCKYWSLILNYSTPSFPYPSSFRCRFSHPSSAHCPCLLLTLLEKNPSHDIVLCPFVCLPH